MSLIALRLSDGSLRYGRVERVTLGETWGKFRVERVFRPLIRERELGGPRWCTSTTDWFDVADATEVWTDADAINDADEADKRGRR